MPISFDQVRDRHKSDRVDSELAPDIDDVHRVGDRRISREGPHDRLQPPAASPSATREDVRSRGQELRSRTQTRESDIDARAEILRTEDGTLATRRSLLKRSARQVQEDVGASIDGVKKAVRDLLKK